MAPVLLFATMLSLGGCSVFSDGLGERSNISSAQSAAARPSAPLTDAEEVAAAVDANLEKLAMSSPSPTRQQMTQALLDAGATVNSVEVSIDQTPTGLAVDAIQAATKVTDQCIIAQVREGQVTVSLLPILTTGHCFIGDQR